jgi:hypothetical protein
LQIIPIEVKSGTNLQGKSLQVYRSRYQPQLLLRFSMSNLKQDGSLLNLPLFMADWAVKMIGEQ